MNNDDLDALVSAHLEAGTDPRDIMIDVREETGCDVRTAVDRTRRSLQRLSLFGMNQRAVEVLKNHPVLKGSRRWH